MPSFLIHDFYNSVPQPCSAIFTRLSRIAIIAHGRTVYFGKPSVLQSAFEATIIKFSMGGMGYTVVWDIVVWDIVVRDIVG